MHLAELGESVFLEPNESDAGHQFDVERLRTSTMDILRQYGFTETTQMMEETFSVGQAYV
jgi:hypothetical protein